MKKHYRHENDCLNCGSELQGKFCHNCGQENLQIKESFGHMMNHAISDYFHFDHQFFHTLRPLIFKPGKLTNEYMAGKRVQYLHPIKMYIFISLVYFILVFKGHKSEDYIKINEKPVTKEQKQHIRDSVNHIIAVNPNLSSQQKKIIQKYATKGIKVGDSKDSNDEDKDPEDTIKTYKQYLASQQKLLPAERDGLFEGYFKRVKYSYTEKYGKRAKEQFVEEVQHNMPKMMFVLLPLFALILKITFWRNKKFYVEHLIYSFHLHCFLFLLYTVIIIMQFMLPDDSSISGWLGFGGFIGTIWYVYRSLRTVYHRSRFRTITKMMGMSFSYFFVGCICLLGLLLITAMTA